MLKLALRRIAVLIPTLLIIVTLAFAIIRLAPGGPFEEEQGASPAVRANIERLYGFDQPLAVQYLRYLRALAHGDFGPSLRQRDFTVTELIQRGLPLSATLGLCAVALAPDPPANRQCWSACLGRASVLAVSWSRAFRACEQPLRTGPRNNATIVATANQVTRPIGIHHHTSMSTSPIPDVASRMPTVLSCPITPPVMPGRGAA